MLHFPPLVQTTHGFGNPCYYERLGELYPISTKLVDKRSCLWQHKVALGESDAKKSNQFTPLLDSIIHFASWVGLKKLFVFLAQNQPVWVAKLCKKLHKHIFILKSLICDFDNWGWGLVVVVDCNQKQRWNLFLPLLFLLPELHMSLSAWHRVTGVCNSIKRYKDEMKKAVMRWLKYDISVNTFQLDV